MKVILTLILILLGACSTSQTDTRRSKSPLDIDTMSCHSLFVSLQYIVSHPDLDGTYNDQLIKQIVLKRDELECEG